MSKFLGVLSILIGIVLAIGNRTGAFPTFPFAGTIFMILGIFCLSIRSKK